MKRRSFVCAPLLIWASFLLLYRLGERSLWEDEVVTLFKLRGPFLLLLLYQKNVVYTLLLSLWSRWSQSEFWLRGLSVFFGLFSILALYELGKRFFSAAVGGLAALLFATSVYFVLETRQVRPFGLVFLLSIISLYLLIEFLETGHQKHLVTYTGVCLLAFFSHYLFIFLLVAEALFIFFFCKKRLRFPRGLFKKALPFFCFLLLLAVPAFSKFQYHLNVLLRLHLFPSTPESLSIPLGFFGKTAFIYYLFTVGPTLLPWNLPWVGSGLALHLFILFNAVRSRNSFFYGKLMLLGFSVPIFLTSVLKNFQPRYALAGLPCYCLLLAVGLMNLKGLWRKLSIAGLLLVSLYGLTNYYLGRQFIFMAYLEPYREIASFVERRSLPGDALLFSQPNPSFAYYFFSEASPPKKVTRLGLLHGIRRHKITLKTWGELQRKLPEGSKRLWFIEHPPGQFMGWEMVIPDPQKVIQENLDFRNFLEERFKLVERRGYLQDPDIAKKKRLVPKPYLSERITVSLYELSP